MKASIKSLWPAPPRPLKPGEQLQPGQAVYIAGNGTEYRFVDWLWCGRTRYALMHYKDGRDGNCYVADEAKVRVGA